MTDLREWIEPGIPNGENSFLLQGEWWRFKNLNDFVAQHPNMFDADDEIESLESEVEDKTNEIESNEELFEEVDEFFEEILEKMVNFDVTHQIDLTRAELVATVDKEEQSWYNYIMEFRQEFTTKKNKKHGKSKNNS
jgi:dipeptidase